MADALQVKLRPTTFKGMVGNEDLIVKVRAIIKAKEYPQTWLWHGPSGCGKTTLARIVSRLIGCKGGDLREYNIADFRGIETAREIVQQTQYRPQYGGTAKVFLLDEAHQLTKDAQNALLKVLEEPPDNIFFMLCTTDPAKLIATVRNRCTPFEVQLLDEDECEKLGKQTAAKVKADIPIEIIEYIAKNALGCARSVVRMVDEVRHLKQEDMGVTVERVAALESQTIELCRLLTKRGNWKAVSRVLKGLTDEPEKIRISVFNYALAMLYNGAPQASTIMEEFREPFYGPTARGQLALAAFLVCQG